MKSIVLLGLIFMAQFAQAFDRCLDFNKLICKQLQIELGYKPTNQHVFFIKSIIEKESGWDTTTIRTEPDGKQSYGLMHVLDSTAYQMGLGDERELLNPQVGLYYGIKYAVLKIKNAQDSLKIDSRAKKFNLWQLSAASYNAGSIRFRKDGTLISHREKIMEGKYLTYEEAVTNLMGMYQSSCIQFKQKEICN